jgi:RND family efflux transporter MFP subunit
MKRTIYLLIIALMAGLSLQSCGEEKKIETKSMEELHKEQGVPVRTVAVQSQELIISLNYMSTLEGIKQTTVASMVGDKVEKFKVKVGSAVTENQVIVEFPTNNPALQFTQAKVSYEYFKKMYDRMTALLAGGETSQQNYDNVETQYLVSKRNYESLKQMLFVEAPISGIVVEKFTEEGHRVKIGDNLFTIAQIDRMKAIFWVTDQELAFLKNGMEVQITKNDKVYKGRISEVALAQDMMRKAFKIEAEFPNGSRELKVGMTVDIKFDSYKNPNAIVIPRSAIVVKEGRNFVYLANGTGALEQEVSLGKTQGENIEILSGLKPGDQLIYQGVSLMSNGAKIKIEQ